MKRWAAIVLLCAFVVGCAEWTAIETAIISVVRMSSQIALDDAVLYVCNAARMEAVRVKYNTAEDRAAYDAFCKASRDK